MAFGAERAEAPEPAVTRRRRGSHRARPGTGLRAVRGALPAAIIAALRALRHHPAGSHALLTAAGGTAATAATAAIVASVAIGAPPHGPAAAHPSRLVPPGVTWTASPEPSPAARVRARPRLDVRSASPPPPAAAAPLPPVPVTSAPVPPPAAGVLTADTTALELSGTYVGEVTVTAAGGPVSWGVVAGPALAVSASGGMSGVLQAGESVTLVVTVDPAARVLGGRAVVRVYPGIQVAVSWDGTVPVAGGSPGGPGLPG